jgi:hypothetical protein
VSRFLLAMILAATAVTQAPVVPVAQDDTHGVRQPTASELETRLKQEAKKTRTSRLSPLFKSLAGATMRRDLRLSPQQWDLTKQLEELGCSTIEGWLLRGLSERPRPSAVALAERLSPRGAQTRAEIAAHFDAILVDGILRPEQARSLCKATPHKVRPLLLARDVELVGDEGSLSEPATVELVRHVANIYSRHGTFWQALLGSPGVRAANPNGIDHLPPERQVWARHEMPQVKFPNAQLDQAEKVERLCIAIWRAWLIRDLDERPPPTPDALAARLGPAAHARGESLLAHAERIVLAGILSPEQSDECLRAAWSIMGLRALLDPALVARLRLSSSQREQILSLFQLKTKTAQDDRNASLDLWDLREKAEVAEQLKQMAGEALAHEQEFDGLIWSVLNSTQAKQLASAIGSALPTLKTRKARRT